MGIFGYLHRPTEPVDGRSCRRPLASNRRMIASAIAPAVVVIALVLAPGMSRSSARQGEPGSATQAQSDREKSTPNPARPPLAAEFHQDFRNAQFDPRTMQRVGGYAEEFVRPDKDGLRIRIPPGLNNPEAVGVALRSRVRGDFEITVSFAIIKADEPIRGYGVAATLWAETNNRTRDAVTIERGTIPKEGERFTSTWVNGPSRTRKYDVRRAMARSRSGKLRMERVGKLVTTSYADGDKPFRALRTVELGSDDMVLIRLGAETGMSDHSVEVLLEDVTIRAEALPGLRLAPRADHPEPAQTKQGP